MNYSTTKYPETNQVLIVLITLFVLRFTAKFIFNFIDSETLKQFCSGILSLSVLLIFMLYMIKRDIIDAKQFRFDDVKVSVAVAGILGGLSISLLPIIPRLSYLDDTQIDNIAIDAVYNKVDLWYFFYMCLIAPVFEEILFRVLILGNLLRLFSPLIAIVVSSILFSLLHLSILETFLFACFIGWIYYYTQNIIYPIIIHGFSNLLAFATRYLLSHGYSSFNEINSLFDDNKVVISTICLSFILASIYYLYRMQRRLKIAVEEKS
jgi:membrane protease YdiL (CAAX protease family)